MPLPKKVSAKPLATPSDGDYGVGVQVSPPENTPVVGKVSGKVKDEADSLPPIKFDEVLAGLEVLKSRIYLRLRKARMENGGLLDTVDQYQYNHDYNVVSDTMSLLRLLRDGRLVL